VGARPLLRMLVLSGRTARCSGAPALRRAPSTSDATCPRGVAGSARRSSFMSWSTRWAPRISTVGWRS
jgi:hypothetical protein